MSAGFVGYVIGLVVMAIAVTGILQFILIKIFKKRLVATYLASGLLGLVLVAASTNEIAALVVTPFFVIAMFALYRRDVRKARGGQIEAA